MIIFALIGIGAYLTIYLDLPIKPVAIALTVAFMAFNIFGAKETTGFTVRKAIRAISTTINYM